MGIKRSLGSSPLDDGPCDGSAFRFVSGGEGGHERSDTIFDHYNSQGSLSLASSFSKKVVAGENTECSNNHKPEKKIASYYLEIETITQLKAFADKNNTSYSAIVEKAIQRLLAESDILGLKESFISF